MSKYLFTLKNIDVDEIDARYGIVSLSSLVDQKPPVNTTKIVDLVGDSNNKTISFLDNTKKARKCKVSIIDFASRLETSSLNYNCYWDRHPLPKDTVPLGCPIRYVSRKVTKTYKSAISKDMYTINEDISKKKAEKLENVEGFKVEKYPYYETDGVFCSFDCMCAFLNDNKHNPLYQDSCMLMSKMYNELFDAKPEKINSAGHWRTLVVYGGWLSIEKFRESFGKVDYKSHGYITNLPLYKPMGAVYEKMLKF